MITEFLLSFVLVGGLSVVLFILNYTLFVVEAVQYVSFASSRAHMAGNINPAKQREAAQKKFESLTKNGTAIGQFFKSDWYEISKKDQLDIRQGPVNQDITLDKADNFGKGDAWEKIFQGVSIQLTPNVMNQRLTGLGSTNPDGDASGFMVKITSILSREPTQLECQKFFEKRKEKNLWKDKLSDTSLETLGTEFLNRSDDFYLGEDNGC